MRRVREALPLSHEVQIGPPRFLNLKRCLGAAGSSPSPRLGQQLVSKERGTGISVVLIQHAIMGPV